PTPDEETDEREHARSLPNRPHGPRGYAPPRAAVSAARPRRTRFCGPSTGSALRSPRRRRIGYPRARMARAPTSPPRGAAPWPLALLVLVLVLAAPTRAHASPNECDLSGRWRAIEDGNAALVPTDGAFVIHGDRSSLVTAAGILAPVTVTVTLDDLEVDGAI